MKKTTVYISLLFIMNILLFIPLFAQDNGMLTKLRLAQEFEEAMEWEQAVPLYEDLVSLEPDNFIFLAGLQRVYTQIKEYDKALKIIRIRLILQPKDITLMTALGGLLYDSGNETAADSAWKSALKIDPKNMQTYRIVANGMMNHRLYEQCIRTYLSGRSISGNDTMFSDALGGVYSALQRYASAAQEYFSILKIAPYRSSFVQSRLNTFIARPEALQAVLQIAKSEVGGAPDNIEIRRLYAWLLLKDQMYDNALEQYRAIDRISKANGRELFNFGQRLCQEHAYKTASEAFKDIINNYDNSSLLPNARFEYTRALEELTKQTGGKNYNDILIQYEVLANERINVDITAQSLYRIGIIKYENLFDLDGALGSFNELRNIGKVTNVTYDAVLRIGEIYTMRSDIQHARKEYEFLSKLNTVFYQDAAAYKLAELEYFEAKFDSALSYLKRFNTNISTDLANDALQLQYFIKENRSSNPAALIRFAKADLLMKQRKYSESIVQFQETVKYFRSALLADDAMMKIGELNLTLGRPENAITAFRFVIDSVQLSILKDKAMFRIAEIYQAVPASKGQAIDTYEKILIDFPNSLYAEESRRRIRALRGDGQ
jgi:tetratricopeptide (TPR) repeat protein